MSVCAFVAAVLISQPVVLRSIQEFGASSSGSAEANRAAIQKAIDWASPRGASLWIEPGEKPYEVAPGLVLKHNVSLVGAQGPVGRGTWNPAGKHPVGSVLAVRGRDKPFITVESATQIKGVQFWYPEQTLDDPSKVIEYPPTIQVSQTAPAQGVTLRDLTFYGEFTAMDLWASEKAPCEQILIEHCYGYPLSGRFVRIGRCYDVPRILNTHVNPANMRLFKGGFAVPVVDSVVKRKTFAYEIDFTDNAQLSGVFTFGTYGGIRLGPASYGQLSTFNFDCVTVGIEKNGDSDFNRNWMVTNGSIIANTGDRLQDVHPVVVRGQGHLALTAVEAFSGGNGALTTLGKSQDFMRIEGDKPLTVSMVGCRMRNYESADPITVLNPKAKLRAVACYDRSENLFEKTLP